MGLVLLIGSVIILIGLITYIRIKNDRDIHSLLTGKFASKQHRSNNIPHSHTQTITPLRPKTLNSNLLNKEVRHEENTPIKATNTINQCLKGCSTLGAVEKEKIRQKLLLSSNKKANNQFKLLDKDDYNVNHNLIKVLKMDDYLLNDDTTSNATFNDSKRNRNEIIFENDEHSILNFAF